MVTTTPAKPPPVSPNYAVGLPNGATLIDAHGAAWRTTSGNQISVNGVVDPVTHGVTKIIYAGAKIWQIAPSGWYCKILPADPWTFSAAGLYSASGAVVKLGETGGLVDPRNYVWTLSAAGVIAVDSTPDAATHHVTQITYYTDQIWQNTVYGWYFKTLPTDAWTFSATAPGVSGGGGGGGYTRTTALGAQLGDPGFINNGSSTWFDQFRAALNEAPTVFTTYATPDSNADWTQTQPWKDAANWSSYGIHNLNALPGAAPITIPLIGLPLAKFQNGNEKDFADIQAGRWDAQFAAVYDTYIAAGFTTLYSRPGFEMNGDWFAWSKPYGQATPAFNAAFAKAFAHCAQHAYNYAAAHPGITIQTVWNPGYMYDAANGARPDVTQLYPGDQYVDHIGIDTYGPYLGGGGAPSNGPSQVHNDYRYFGLDDAIKMCIAHNKPLCFPETGCSPGETAFQTNIKNRLTASPNCKVSFVGIWDQPTGNGSNSVWSTDAKSGAAWKAMFTAVRAANGPW